MELKDKVAVITGGSRELERPLHWNLIALEPL